MADRMPPRHRIGVERLSDVSFLDHVYQKWQRGEPTYPSRAARRVLGMGLPSWQREFVWTDVQCTRFVESLWKGINIGSWMINVVDQDPDNPLDGLVIDGQQRLTALQKYLDNEFPVAAADGSVLLWRDLTVIEQRRFRSSPFPHIETRINDETALRALYDLLNYGGTPHREDERASERSAPRPDLSARVPADETGRPEDSGADDTYFDVDAPRA